MNSPQEMWISSCINNVDHPPPRRWFAPHKTTAYIDASNVYDSNPGRTAELRTGVDGRLKTSSAGNGELRPFTTARLPNAGGPSPGLFLAGDIRANEQIGLTATHVLLVRE